MRRKYKDLLDVASRNGGLTIHEGREVYTNDSGFYRAAAALVDLGYLKKEKAPERSEINVIYVLTTKGKEYISYS